MCAVALRERASLLSSERTELSSVELFSGGGGLALGTHLAGFKHKLLVERDEPSVRTLRRNAAWSGIPNVSDWSVESSDVRRISFSALGPVDLVAGGPPCQPFSIGGKHRGMTDERNMIPQFARAVRELRPRAFIMENVRGLTRPSFIPYFGYVLRELAHPEVARNAGETWEEHNLRLISHERFGTCGLSYTVKPQLVNAADYGIPQVRQRVFVVGMRSDLSRGFRFPEPTYSEAALDEAKALGTYWREHALPPDAVSCAPSGSRAFVPAERWRTVRDAIWDLPPPTESGLTDAFNHRQQPGARPYVGHTGSPWDLPSKTLKAGDHGVPGGENMLRDSDGSVRYFTVREAARLQTFPDEWSLEGPWSEAMRQLGNAVPVRLAYSIATALAEQLR